MKQNTWIEEVVINHCCLSAGKLSRFATELGECQTLRVLDLSSNKLEGSGSPLINRIIKSHGEKKNEAVWLYGLRNEAPPKNLYQTGLCELDIHDNEIGDCGAEEICRCLVNDNWLQSLNLRKNKIDAQGCSEFVRLLEKNESLLSVDLRENPGFNRKLSHLILEKLNKNMDTFKKKINKTKDLTIQQQKAVPRHSNTETSKKTLQIPIKSPKPDKNNDEECKKLLLDLKESPVNPKMLADYEERLPKNKKPVKSNNRIIPEKSTRLKGLREIDPKCEYCRDLDKQLLKAEGRIINLCLENFKLKSALDSKGVHSNSCSLILTEGVLSK